MKLLPFIIVTLFTQNIMAQKTDNFSLKEEKTTIKFIGEYYTGRDPCQHLPNGTRRWRQIAGFKVKTPLLGNIKVKHIEITPNYYNNNSTGVDNLLETGQDYMITLKLDKERVELLENKDTHFTHLNLITNDEIEAIAHTMFELANCLEFSGGVGVTFSKGENTQSITILKDEKAITISAPNKKGSFGWKKIKSFTYKKTEEKKGIFTVYFIDKIPGAESGFMTFGLITKECWERIRANTMGEIKMIEVHN